MIEQVPFGRRTAVFGHRKQTFTKRFIEFFIDLIYISSSDFAAFIEEPCAVFTKGFFLIEVAVNYAFGTVKASFEQSLYFSDCVLCVVINGCAFNNRLFDVLPYLVTEFGFIACFLVFVYLCVDPLDSIITEALALVYFFDRFRLTLSGCL